MPHRTVTVERVYDHPGDEVPFRVLVDRLWPRGLRRDAFHYDEWAQNLAPSTDLRKWYAHDTSLFTEFRDRYRRELASPAASDAIARLDEAANGRALVLLTATRDVEHSGAQVLADYLREH